MMEIRIPQIDVFLEQEQCRYRKLAATVIVEAIKEYRRTGSESSRDFLSDFDGSLSEWLRIAGWDGPGYAEMIRAEIIEKKDAA